jgi:hypothetical protein
MSIAVLKRNISSRTGGQDLKSVRVASASPRSNFCFSSYTPGLFPGQPPFPNRSQHTNPKHCQKLITKKSERSRSFQAELWTSKEKFCDSHELVFQRRAGPIFITTGPQNRLAYFSLNIMESRVFPSGPLEHGDCNSKVSVRKSFLRG